MPSEWYAARQREVAQLERRKALLGRSRAGVLAGAYILLAVTLALTTILFAALSKVSSDLEPPPRVMALPDGGRGLQVIRADPIPLSQVGVFLSAPGQVELNGPPGLPVVGTEVPLAPAGQLAPGDTLRVCTLVPVPSVELVLRDQESGAILDRHTFANPRVCA